MLKILGYTQDDIFRMGANRTFRVHAQKPYGHWANGEKMYATESASILAFRAMDRYTLAARILKGFDREPKTFGNGGTSIGGYFDMRHNS